MNYIKIVVKEPGRDADVYISRNALNSYQCIVGGYIEILPYPGKPTFDIVCNEIGRMWLKNPPLLPNITTPTSSTIFGTIFVTKTDKVGDFQSLTKQEIGMIIDDLNKRSC